jgi:3-methyladenine DNA glycosylase/8-oxoguanine DNA glycosylase
MVLGYAYGDPDVVPLGDLHIPSLVTSALAGESEGTDPRMLELLEPYRGHRFRVIRLLRWAERHAPHVLAMTGTARG